MRTGCRLLYFIACTFLLCAAFNLCRDGVQRHRLSLPFDRGILQSDLAILAMAYVAILMAVAFGRLEKRRRPIETPATRDGARPGSAARGC
jgi:hypothetical protein